MMRRPCARAEALTEGRLPYPPLGTVFPAVPSHVHAARLAAVLEGHAPVPWAVAPAESASAAVFDEESDIRAKPLGPHQPRLAPSRTPRHGLSQGHMEQEICLDGPCLYF